MTMYNYYMTQIVMFKRIIKKIENLIKSYQRKKDEHYRKKEYDKLVHSYKRYEKVKLHFGCGPRILKGWINIDLNYEPNYQNYDFGEKYYPSKIRGTRDDFFAINIFEMGLPLPDNSVDVIFHEDFIEHLDQKEQFQFLAETFRVMKKGALQRVNSPNLLTVMKKKSNFLKGIAGVYTDEWSRWNHKNVLTPLMLKEMATTVGYTRVLFNKRDGSTSKLIPLEFRPSSDRPNKDGNIFADLIK